MGPPLRTFNSLRDTWTILPLEFAFLEWNIQKVVRKKALEFVYFAKAPVNLLERAFLFHFCFILFYVFSAELGTGKQRVTVCRCRKLWKAYQAQKGYTDKEAGSFLGFLWGREYSIPTHRCVNTSGENESSRGFFSWQSFG